MTDETSRVSEKAVEAAREALINQYRRIWPGSWPARPEASALAHAALTAALPHLQPHPNAGQAESVTVEGLFPNVDAWGAAEWFERLVRAVESRNQAVRDKDDFHFELYNNIAKSAGSRLANDYADVIRSALSPIPAAPVQSEGVDTAIMHKLVANYGGHSVTAVRDGKRMVGWSGKLSVSIAELRSLFATPIPAAPVQSEPYAWLGEGAGFKSFTLSERVAEGWAKKIKVVPVYTSPQPVEPASGTGEPLMRKLEAHLDETDPFGDKFTPREKQILTRQCPHDCYRPGDCDGSCTHPTPGAGEGRVGEMTAERAVYFLERFKGDEKMLGPNEQWALDFAIDVLSGAGEDAEREAGLVEALGKLEKAATSVSRRGATTGNQWLTLSAALVSAREALSLTRQPTKPAQGMGESGK